jgi:hypothetical protein
MHRSNQFLKDGGKIEILALVNIMNSFCNILNLQL